MAVDELWLVRMIDELLQQRSALRLGQAGDADRDALVDEEYFLVRIGVRDDHGVHDVRHLFLLLFRKRHEIGRADALHGGDLVENMHIAVVQHIKSGRFSITDTTHARRLVRDGSNRHVATYTPGPNAPRNRA